MNPRIVKLNSLGQSVWYDNIRRSILSSGELNELINLGVSGLTSNPTLFEKAIIGDTDYDSDLKRLALKTTNYVETYETLAIQDIQDAADLLRPVYEKTNGIDGYASLEVNPTLAYDTEATVREAKRLFIALDRPNVMIKVPATLEGIPAIRHLIGAGINVNITLIFSLDVYSEVMSAYIDGLEDLHELGGDISKVSSVASFFVSRIDTAVDNIIKERSKDKGQDLDNLLGKTAISNAQLAYAEFTRVFESVRFEKLRLNGGRTQRPLWASTSTKNPSYDDVMYVESLIGPDTVNTMPPETISAFLDHGRVTNTISNNVHKAKDHMADLENSEIHIDEVTKALLKSGVDSFADSFHKLINTIKDKTEQQMQQEVAPASELMICTLNDHYASLIHMEAERLVNNETIKRIWDNDHTVWNDDPNGIADRLGWLDIKRSMEASLPIIETFSCEIKKLGYRHIVLLGMGGSSLGARVISEVIGKSPGFPDLIVLDSTIPSWITKVNDEINPSRTLFIVSSKSGDTIEVLSLYKYFRQLVNDTVGANNAGNHFIAITDPGSPLESIAKSEKFRKIFLNPANIGGRYSVLSNFGLLPSALIGINIRELIHRADNMAKTCASPLSILNNPGGWLGAMLGEFSKHGTDKLTLITSPPINIFGLWIEQLIAESTGKDGKGIIPQSNEPLADPGSYGTDRLFVYIRLEGANNYDLDLKVATIRSMQNPVIQITMPSVYDLGNEFFRWEFATAIAGAVLGINPFDQPDVQHAKEVAKRALKKYKSTEKLYDTPPYDSLTKILHNSNPKKDYLAILAYVDQSMEFEELLTELRIRMMIKYNIATTFGYGPRYLHSTGQMHKGGPNNGIFIHITQTYRPDLDIPGESYTFGELVDAQSYGDLKMLESISDKVVHIHIDNHDFCDLNRLIDSI